MKCVITFQTDSILQTFMLRFEHLALDCNDHLYIFDGDHEYGKYEMDLSCRSTRSDVRTFYTKSNHVTLKYITDSWGHAGNGFKLVITAIKKPVAGCKNFRCQNKWCISQNLTCDGVNHCGDDSDETSQAYCGDETATKQILGLNFGTFVSLVLGIFLICCVCIVGVIICVFRKEAQQRQLETEAQLGTPHSMVVGQSPYPSLTNHSRAYFQQSSLPAGGEATSLSGKYVPPQRTGRQPQRRHLLSCKVVKSATGRRRPQPPKKEWLVCLQLPCHAIRMEHIGFHSKRFVDLMLHSSCLLLVNT